jgi:ABC-type transport system substrate-binding protein
MAYAFDKVSFNTLKGGRMEAKNAMFIGYDDFVRQSPNFPVYNVDKARELLEAEGYNASNPLRFTLTCNTESDPGLEMFQSTLKQLNVEFTFNIVEFSVYLAAEMSGEYEMAYTPQPNTGNHPLTDVDRFDVNVYQRNCTRYYNQRVQELVEQFRFIPTSDPKLKQVADELSDIIAQEVPMIAIFIMEENCAMDKNLSGVELSNRVINFRNATYTG